LEAVALDTKSLNCRVHRRQLPREFVPGPRDVALTLDELFSVGARSSQQHLSLGDLGFGAKCTMRELRTLALRKC
jgi:hypothetical protein